MIKAFLFDYDGVITKLTPDINHALQISQLLDISEAAAQKLFDHFWPKYLRGKMTDDQIWEYMQSQTGKLVPKDKRNIWKRWEQLDPLPSMLQIVADLRKNGYMVGLLTNVTPTTASEIQQHGGYNGFDFVIRSYEVGFAKPDPGMFKLALAQLSGLLPSEIVFIDDRASLLPAAQSLGLQTIHATDEQTTIATVKQLTS
jgi:epoxide hydrolase-like predicted phosphatase